MEAAYFFALAPIFARSRSEKCFKPAESPTETLATQATLQLNVDFSINALILSRSLLPCGLLRNMTLKTVVIQR